MVCSILWKDEAEEAWLGNSGMMRVILDREWWMCLCGRAYHNGRALWHWNKWLQNVSLRSLKTNLAATFQQQIVVNKAVFNLLFQLLHDAIGSRSCSSKCKDPFQVITMYVDINRTFSLNFVNSIPIWILLCQYKFQYTAIIALKIGIIFVSVRLGAIAKITISGSHVLPRTVRMTHSKLE